MFAISIILQRKPDSASLLPHFRGNYITDAEAVSDEASLNEMKLSRRNLCSLDIAIGSTSFTIHEKLDW
jgi:hypothetical protein